MPLTYTYIPQYAGTGLHDTAFVPYIVTAGYSLTGNIHRLLPVLCCLVVIL